MDGHAEASVELGAITRNIAALRKHAAKDAEAAKLLVEVMKSGG